MLSLRTWYGTKVISIMHSCKTPCRGSEKNARDHIEFSNMRTSWSKISTERPTGSIVNHLEDVLSSNDPRGLNLFCRNQGKFSKQTLPKSVNTVGIMQSGRTLESGRMTGVWLPIGRPIQLSQFITVIKFKTCMTFFLEHRIGYFEKRLSAFVAI